MDVFIIRDFDEKILGIINFNNMIPVIDSAIIYFNIKEEICQQSLKNIAFWHADAISDNVNKKFIKK